MKLHGHRRPFTAASLVCLACSLVTCTATNHSRRPSPQDPPTWPTVAWITSTPEEQGIDSEKLADVVERASAPELFLHSLVVVRHGVLVLDVAFGPYDGVEPHDIASVTKSVTGLLVGIAVDEHAYPQGVRTHLDTIFGRGPADRSLEDLLTMTTGWDCFNGTGGDVAGVLEMMRSDDWVDYALSLPTVGKPGKTFHYCSEGSHLLGASIRRMTGIAADDFARQRLFGPLGIERVAWPRDPANRDPHGWGDLRMRPTDMAKVGLLALHGGRWDGHQIVSEAWVRRATSAIAKVEGDDYFDGYGYQWWVSAAGGYFSANGRGGQHIVVIPSVDLVVVTTSGGGGDEAAVLRGQLIRDFVVPAARPGALAPNPEGVRRLARAISRSHRSGTSAGGVPPIPESAVELMGRAWRLADNPFGLDSVQFDYAAGNASGILTVDVRGAVTRYVVGMDGAPRRSPGRFDATAVASGSFDGDTIVIDLDEVSLINHWILRIAPRDGGAAYEIRDLAGNPTISGTAR